MAATIDSQATHERTVGAASGWWALVIGIALLVAAPVLWVTTIAAGQAAEIGDGTVALRMIAGVLLVVAGVVALLGLFTLQPNEGRVQILFGSYKGTVRKPGFHWANPFYSRHRGLERRRDGDPPIKSIWAGGSGPAKLSTKLSLRAHNFNSDKLKVNDRNGNPVEIAAVIVWRVADTAQAVFDVDDFESYVEVQSESAIRRIASLYAYDQGEEDEITLRGGGDEIAHELKQEVQARLDTAGIHVEEARITHLAYAPEIASAMLRRQQAEAVIAARSKIVLGAVSMVEMALRDLETKGLVDLDPERRAAMVSNLLVVLCGTSEAAPVINTGTLYT
jgi:regulator of protease activity HflC (stomatin/prohibitin superfamily)